MRRGRSKEVVVHKLFLSLGGTFIGVRCLKEAGRLLENYRNGNRIRHTTSCNTMH